MNNQFFKLPLTMYELELSKSAIMLYAILYGNANKLGYAYGSNKYYAKLLKCSERTISNCIKILKDNNLIKVSNPKSFRRKIYIVTE